MPLENRKGKWHLRYQVQGKKVHVSTGLNATERNRKKAEALEVTGREALSLERRFNVRQRENKSFADAADEFQKWLVSEYGDTPNTINSYRVALNHCRRSFENQIVSSIDGGDVEGFKADRSKAAKPGTVRIDLMVLNKFFKYCKKRSWCSENPADDVSWPSPGDNGRIRVLTYEEEKKFFATVGDDQDLRDIVTVLLNHGLRPSELLQLRKEDVSLGSGRFVIQRGKTRAARRTVTLTPETLPIFQRRIKLESAWMFPRPHKLHKPIRLQTMDARLRKAGERSGMKFILYDCRHTFATRLLDSGATAVVVAKLLGHANLATVHRYVHPAESILDDAMKVYSEARQFKLAS